jgi:hypothetical protein
MKSLSIEIANLENDIPELKKAYRDDFFSISGFPHWETVMSNWFALFMDSSKQHGFTGLFTDSLKAIILSKRPEAQLDWLNDQALVFQEQMTKKGNFIDLVVFDKDLEIGNSFSNALVIEHKVDAALYNDLQDYFESITVESSKLGLVLSAKSLRINNSNFLNITYNELIRQLKTKLGEYAINGDKFYLNYLFDFINNLDRMSEELDTSAIDFCFRHGETIQKIHDLKQRAENDLTLAIQKVLLGTGYDFYRKYPSSITMRAMEGQVSLIIRFDELFSKKVMELQYWLYKESVPKWNAVPDHSELREKLPNNFKVMEKKIGKEWIELFRTEISFELNDDSNDIADQLTQYLRDYINPASKIVWGIIQKHNQ